MGELDGRIELVSSPTYGTGYLFTARDCRVPATYPGDETPYDCINQDRALSNNGRALPQGVQGGGAGMGGFSYQFSPMDTDMRPNVERGAVACIIGTARRGAG